jgi:predicted NBD/HSP70 family sugar kinase
MTRQDLFIGIDVDGATGAAGEIGHMTVLPWVPYRNCGNRGCLEALASGPAIAGDVQEMVRRGVPTSSLSWLQATPSGSQPS